MKKGVDHYSLSNLQDLISSTLSERFVDNLWVVAEVAEIKINISGHCYLDLIEKRKESNDIAAKVRGIIWSKQARFLLPYFQSTTGSQLSDGMKILIKVKVEYNKLYGLSLIISDIDPSYTIGEVALKKALILKALKEEGVAEMNKELIFPIFPQRIAVISSEGAAGYTDFCNHLNGNSFGYSFNISLFPSVMQGKDTSSSIISSLNKIHQHVDEYDVVVIVRGGGSLSDLSWFDDYDIAYLLTQFPLPILTGIGHEKDISVCDMVAYKSLKTPTAAADFFIEIFSDIELYINTIGRRITQQSGKQISSLVSLIENYSLRVKPLIKRVLKEYSERVTRYILSIPPLTKVTLISNRNLISSIHREISFATKTKLESSERELTSIKNLTIEQINRVIIIKNDKLNSIEKELRLLCPESILKRGYSYTSKNGKIVKDIGALKQGDKVLTTLWNGSFESDISEINE
jgi:exodeoxyribonuclease VII large subunit